MKARARKAAEATSRQPKSEADFYSLMSPRLARLIQAKRMDEALALCTRAIEEEPPEFVAWGYATRAALLLEIGGREDDALADCNRAIKLEPFENELPITYGIRAKALQKLGRLAEAKDDIDQALTLLYSVEDRFGLWPTFGKISDDIRRELGESKKAEYNYRMPQASEAISQVAAAFNIPDERRDDLAKMIEDFAASARATTLPATATPRLKWGYDRRDGENPAAFAWRAYQAEAKAGTLHLGVIRQEDEPLAVKLVSWLRSPANRQQVPEGFDIPTKPEWIERRRKEIGEIRPAPRPRTEEQRIYDVLTARRYRERHGSPT